MSEVYIIHAAECESSDPYELYSYAAASSYELAEKIAQKDEEDGQICKGWNIEKMFLHMSDSSI